MRVIEFWSGSVPTEVSIEKKLSIENGLPGGRSKSTHSFTLKIALFMTFLYKKRQGASALAGLVYGWASPVPHPQNRTTEYS